MEKYGYKNISSRNEFEKGSKINFGPVDTKHLSKYDFIEFFCNSISQSIGQVKVDRASSENSKFILAKRPNNMVMNSKKIQSELDLVMPDIYEEIEITARKYLEI